LYKIDKSKKEYATIPDKKYFNTPKIFLREIAYNITCCYDEENYYSLNKAYVIIINHEDFLTKYVLGILNSKLMSWYFRKKFSASHIRGGYLQFKKQYLEQIPIKMANRSKQEEIIKYVDQIHSETNNSKENIENIKSNIDDLVFEIYDIAQIDRDNILKDSVF